MFLCGSLGLVGWQIPLQQDPTRLPGTPPHLSPKPKALSNLEAPCFFSLRGLASIGEVEAPLPMGVIHHGLEFVWESQIPQKSDSRKLDSCREADFQQS